MERFLVEESENEGVGWRESQGGRAIGSLSFPFCHVKNSAEQPAGPVLHTESISMQSSAETVAQYLQELPADRREFIETLRQVIADSIDPRFVETMQYGMITWVIPKDIYPPGYHCKPADCVPFLSLASQKKAVSIYLMNVYYDKTLETRLREGWESAGLRLDPGKACLRVRKVSETALPVLAEIAGATTLDAYLEHYVGVLAKGKKSASAGK